jgi:hypothetical protein
MPSTDAGLRSVALICDAAEGVLDRQFVDRVGIVAIEPFLGLGMVRVVGSAAASSVS